MKTLESNSKIHIEKYMWILTFQKITKITTFINNDILNMNFSLHFDHATSDKILLLLFLITQDLWVHLQLFRD
jgi:hypothetical protein